jgi:hypothetical protein
MLKFDGHLLFGGLGKSKRSLRRSFVRKQLRLMEAIGELALQPYCQSSDFICFVKARQKHSHISVSETIARGSRFGKQPNWTWAEERSAMGG